MVPSAPLLSFLLSTLYLFPAAPFLLEKPPRKYIHSIRASNPLSSFLKKRGGDFFKLGGAEDVEAFGPPAILLHGFPLQLDEAQSIIAAALDIEIEDIKDGGLAVVHLSTAAYGQRLQTVLEAATISTSTAWPSSSGYFSAEAESATTPIIYFSGMPNNDVRASARALIGRLYEVSGMRAGFAKAVPPAMEKVLEDLLGEIAGDHEEALSRGTP